MLQHRMPSGYSFVQNTGCSRSAVQLHSVVRRAACIPSTSIVGVSSGRSTAVNVLCNAATPDVEIVKGKYIGRSVAKVFRRDPRFCLTELYDDNPCFRPIIQELVASEKKNIISSFAQTSGRFCLGQTFFKTKAIAKKMISSWLQCSYKGYIPTQDEMEWIIPLLEQHPRWSSKSVGMAFIEVGFDQNYFHFNIVKADGTKDDISYKKCLEKSRDSTAAVAMKALRWAVQDQTDAFRSTIVTPFVCPLSDTVVVDMADVHVDHVVPFVTLVNNFLQERDLTIEDVPIVTNGCGVLDVVDDSFAKLWVRYHRRHAKLRAVCSKANVSRGSGGVRVIKRVG